MKTILGLIGLAGAALGCANGMAPLAAVADAAPPVAVAAPEPEEYRTFRLGFWEVDLFALDFEPRGTTFRLLDLKILKVLEIGSGPDYHSFSLVEMPVLLNVITTRHEGPVQEHRFADVQALAFAPVRVLRESEDSAETHFLKVPILGSAYSRTIDGPTEHQTYLYLFRREMER